MSFFKVDLCTTTSLEAQVKIRQVLQTNGIRYKLNVKNMTRVTQRGRVGGPGSPAVYEFKVNKEDYDIACHLIQGISLR